RTSRRRSRGGTSRLASPSDHRPSVAVTTARRSKIFHGCRKDTVENACRSRLGDVPAVYTIADLCRPWLLVEIEGIAFGTWA
ncbi:MAG: hypothetical protein WCB27_16790, partial [Thermoguttaceae bacterium]